MPQLKLITSISLQVRFPHVSFIEISLNFPCRAAPRAIFGRTVRRQRKKKTLPKSTSISSIRLKVTAKAFGTFISRNRFKL